MPEDKHRSTAGPGKDSQPVSGQPTQEQPFSWRSLGNDGASSADVRDKQAIVDLAVATLGCHSAVISSVFDGEHTIIASKGDGFAKLEHAEQLVERVMADGQMLVRGPENPGQPLFIGIPLHSGEPSMDRESSSDSEADVANKASPAAVLSIIDVKREALSKDDDQVLANLQAIINSLLEKQDIQRIAAESQSELKLTFEQMDQGITVFDSDARLTLWNQRYADMFEFDPALVYKGASLRDLIDSQNLKNGFEGFATADYEKMLSQLREGLARGETIEGGVRLNSGRIISSIHTAMPDGGWVATHSDITERVLAQEKAERASLHDSMTDLANRSKFTKEFDRCNQQDGRVVIMLIDIDHFKAVNDNYGHEAGDIVIISVAERLKSCVRSTDVVARLGGDEFAILLQLDSHADSHIAQTIARKVVQRMDEQLSFNGAVINYSVSVGCHEATAGQSDLEDMLSCADFALYKAKENGRARYQFFDRSNARELNRSKKMRALVSQDTYAETFTVHYQPITCLQTSIDYSFEALIRWDGSQSEYMSPIDIIQAAEQNGSIGSLGNWVLNQALKDHKAWGGHSRIAVNVSSRQLGNGDFAKQVQEALQRWDLAPERLELEVTETALLEDSTSIEELHEIKQLGVQIALDDFGTGYSSLTLLQRFAFDKLKIDRSFIDQVHADSISHAIVASVIGLGRDLKIETIAEGIETEEHLSAMRSFGCNMGQGYLLGIPMPSIEAAKRLKSAQKVA